MTLSLHAADHQLDLRVDDNGPGIAPALREQALTRFVRLSNTDSDGSGLGLPIVQQFAHSLGGTLTLHEGPGGHGLSARLSLPCAATIGP